MGDQPVSKRVVVRGRLHAVFFRDTASRDASRQGGAGWAANRRHGGVELVVEGQPRPVEAMVEFCRRGPEGAEVEGVDVSDEEPEGLTGFDVR